MLRVFWSGLVDQTTLRLKEGLGPYPTTFKICISGIVITVLGRYLVNEHKRLDT